MSTTSRPISARHLAYIAQHTAGDDRFLLELKAAARVAGIPSISIAPEQASLMQILLRLARAREVVEIGTLAGYSAIVMARALPRGGRVRTIEIDPDRAAWAKAWVAKSDVADRVEVLCGKGLEILATFQDQSADAAFIDADKANYHRYLQHCLRIVRPGGLIMADNALAFGELLKSTARDPEVLAIRRFNSRIAASRLLQAIIVPLGDGLWVGVRSSSGARPFHGGRRTTGGPRTRRRTRRGPDAGSRSR